MLSATTELQQHNEMRPTTTTRWFKYDRDKLSLVYTQSVPVIFEPPCIIPADVKQLQYLQSTFVLCPQNRCPLSDKQVRKISTVSDWRVSSWPLQWYGSLKAERPMSVASNRCTPVKNYFRQLSVFLLSKMYLFFVVFCVLKSVHKFHFKFVINEIPNNWRPAED